ncbi:hypothetical protein CAC42_691 [Sphaceloma murrayae]|uniref:Uncharacterized protein n=1 Tax=Sphaceloma murrayae TaxID=2082308 RepID=A0A2K1QKH5_9PEZI|nr:hypothetical protein CAC42_691 [Sphaceloma murrayae]
MCIRVTERYAGCKCIYFVHGIDACPQFGRHPVEERVVYVGLNCPQHSRRRDSLPSHGQIDGQGNDQADHTTGPIASTYSVSHRDDLKVFEWTKSHTIVHVSGKSAPAALTLEAGHVRIAPVMNGRHGGK